MSLVRAFFCFSQHEPKWRFAHNWGKSRLQLVVRNDASQVSNALSQKWSQIRGDFFSVIIYFTNLQLFIEIEIYFLGDLVCRQPLPFRDQRSTSSLRRSVSNLKGSIAFSPKEKSKAHLWTRRNLPSVEWTSWPISPLRTSHRATQAQWTSARWTTTQGPTCLQLAIPKHLSMNRLSRCPSWDQGKQEWARSFSIAWKSFPTPKWLKVVLTGAPRIAMTFTGKLAEKIWSLFETTPFAQTTRWTSSRFQTLR